MIQYPVALEIIESVAREHRLEYENLVCNPVFGKSYEQLCGRVLAESIASPEEMPPFDNSAMDGFAICADKTANATLERPTRFRVLGTIAAGTRATEAIGFTDKQPVCWEIMTGAPFPSGAFDAVVKIEDVQVIRNDQGQITEILISQPQAKNQFIRPQGEDFKRGDLVLKAGTRMHSGHVMGFAGLGVTDFRVVRKPRIAVLSTGNELCLYNTKNLEPGMIRNSSGPFLETALAHEYSADVQYFGVVSDDADGFLKRLAAIRASSPSPDLIITTGAVSMGKYDFIVEALKRLDAQIYFHKTAIRPGKPALFAKLPSIHEKTRENSPEIPSSLFFGIPGNPVSTAVGLRFLIGPCVRAISGMPVEPPLRVQLAATIEKPTPLRCFMRATLEGPSGGASVLEHQGSAIISSLMHSDGWVVLPEGTGQVTAGSWVDFFRER